MRALRSTHFELEQDLAASPDAVWDFVTDPVRMNLWSDATIAGVALGDGGTFAGVGALREVTVRALGRALSFREVIEHAEPGARLVYRVIEGIPLRRHRGEITLAPRDDGGTHLRWSVEYGFPLPGMAQAARGVLVPQLRNSLVALARVTRGATASDLARAPTVDVRDDASVPALRERVDAIVREQRALADRLEAADDPKRWFTRVYQYVTEAQIDACDSGLVTHRAWVLRLIPRFHDYYVDNLRRWMGDAPGHAEEHWRNAFRAMETAADRYKRPLDVVSRGLARGVQAHIEEDLPRALAEVYAAHYASRCDYARFRADYLLMGGIFRAASERLMAKIPRAYFPMYLRVLDPLLPDEVRDALVKASFYDVARQRRKAFERGERLTRLVMVAAA